MNQTAAPKAKSDKQSRSAKTALKKMKVPRRRAPILLELAYSLFVLIVIGATLSTGVLSLLAGADPLMVVVRSAGALLSTGFILWLVYWLMATSIIEARRQQVLEEAARQKAAAEKAQSTLEFEA
jgi:hypothetical protein